MIPVDINKLKDIAHQVRRNSRRVEFFPFDQKIAAQIPGEADAAEAERVKIRAKYAQAQIEIDAATDWETMRVVLEKYGL